MASRFFHILFENIMCLVIQCKRVTNITMCATNGFKNQRNIRIDNKFDRTFYKCILSICNFQFLMSNMVAIVEKNTTIHLGLIVWKLGGGVKYSEVNH